MAEGVTGLVVVARVGSSRLPGKHLLTAGGRPMIWWLCARMARAFKPDLDAGRMRLVIATSDAPGNEVFAQAVSGLPVAIFRGSDSSIPLRQSQCADEFGLHRIISIDGDDVLCSCEAVRLIADALEADGDPDIISTAGLPLGMNASGYRAAYLKRSVLAAPTGRYETGWGRVFDAPRIRTLQLGDEPIDGPLRFTLDYEEDARFFKAVIEGLGERILGMPDRELVAYVRAKGLHRINEAMQAEYFANFHRERNKEIDG